LTKRNNAREETVAREYRNFTQNELNQELPSDCKVYFIHWDMKAKKRDKKNPYELDLLVYAEKMIKK
jgi:hypothetical protein